MLCFAGEAPFDDTALGQAASRRIARAIVRFGRPGCGLRVAEEFRGQWRGACAGLCPPPAAGQPGLEWDMQAVENLLCGICHCASPEHMTEGFSARRLPTDSKYWTPHPCTALEYRALYG